MNLSGTWPTTFKPEETECKNCSSINLSPLQDHPCQQGQPAHLLTASKYTMVKALVRKCKNCKRLIQYHDKSILNIGDSLFVSMDVIFMMKDAIEEGTPPRTAGHICLKSLCRKSPLLEQQTKGCIEYIARMLSGGFYAVEALDGDDQESQICGICGICPMVLAEDGGEDISCDLYDRNLEVEPGKEDGVFSHE